MKRYGNLFERIVDINNIVRAHLNARRHKTRYKEVRRVDRDVLGYCTKIRQMLIDKTYTTSEYHIFEIEDNGKHREIAELPYYPDRIIQWAIMQVLEEPLMKHFIPTTYAAMSGKKKRNKKFKKRISERGPHAALAKLQEYAEDKDNTRYCLKMDVKKFFPNIDKAILKSLLRRKFKDKDLLWLLDDIVDSYDKGNRKGIPIGSFTSQYFGNFYLSYLDHWAKEQKRVKYYLRYMDDIVILSGDKEYLHRLRDEIAEYLASNLKLTIKENWQVFPSAVRGIDFVGYRYFGEFTLLRNNTKKRLKKAAKRLRRKTERGKRLNLSDRSTLGSYNGILKWCDSTRLKDKTINLFIGGNNGKSKRVARPKAA